MPDAPDAYDPLDEELRGFAPAAPSPGLFDRVARELDAPGRPLRLRPWIAGAVAAMAACLIITAFIWRAHRPGAVDPVRIASTLPAPMLGPDADDRPALATYHRALSGSADALDDLLDRHAARLLPAGGSLTASSELGLR
jgi:hypothetical protein